MTLDTWILHKKPSRASVCIPTVCKLSYANDLPYTRWYPHSKNNVDPIHNIQWKIRGRIGKPISVMFIQDDSFPNTHSWPSGICTTGAGGCQNVAFLKSHLQKCVRKGKACLAVATAKQLLKLDVQQFVRRLAIIMVEDVEFHPTIFGVLVWWTVVLASQSKNTIHCTDVPLWLCEYLLGVVHVLCKHP